MKWKKNHGNRCIDDREIVNPSSAVIVEFERRGVCGVIVARIIDDE